MLIALGLCAGSKQYDVQDLEAWLGSELPFETAGEAYERCTGNILSAHHIHDGVSAIAGDLGVLRICPSKEQIEARIAKMSEGKFRRPVVMIAADGGHAPTRPEPSPRKGKRGKGEWKEDKGFRIYLIDDKKIEHLISWHQVGTDEQLKESLLAID